MTDLHWAIFALRDIKSALDCEKYEIAVFHIDDAINAIQALDADADAADGSALGTPADSKPFSQRL